MIRSQYAHYNNNSTWAMRLQLITALMVLAVFWASCKKDEDTKKDGSRPVIELISPLQSEMPLTVTAESVVSVIIRSTDNEALANLRFSATPLTSIARNAFTPREYPLSGTLRTDTLRIAIPLATQDGDYALRFIAVDKAGNSSDSVRVLIRVTGGADDISPTVIWLSPDEQQIFTQGQVVNVRFQLTDNTALNAAELSLRNEAGTEVISPLSFYSVRSAADTTLTFSFTPAATLTRPATYTLFIEATDANLNKTEASRTIKLQ